MNSNAKSVLTSIVRRQEGQILPWLAFMLISFMGISAFVVDIGRAIIAYHMIQASCDAAAMAGVQLMGADLTQTAANVQAQAQLYSSVAGNKNANPTLLPGTTITKNSVYCSAAGQAAGISCVGAVNTANAITVAQKVVIPTIFAGIIGIPNMTVGATSSALMAGAAAQKYNIAVILDTTSSMGSSDPGGCPGKGLTAEGCAQVGVQTLLQGLAPCGAGSTSSTCNTFDAVSLFTFPSIQQGTASNATNCNSTAKNPTVMPYPTPVAAPYVPAGATTTTYTDPNAVTSSSLATYQVSSYLSNWSSNNQTMGSTGTFSKTNGSLGIAVGGATGCAGMGDPGGDGTWLPGAIYAAASSLQAQQLANPGSKNALIILSDGDQNTTSGKIKASNGLSLNKSGTYPSLDWQCHQGITAAQYAAGMVDASGNKDTTVFTIAYNASSSSSGSCGTDANPPDYPSIAKNPISACAEMAAMASSASTAYADGSSNCPGTEFTIPQIFTRIKTTITNPRLLSPGT
jgi:hypothetical protein